MIIAFGHEAGTGKDTFVMFAIDYLRTRFKNLELQREGFADRLYDLCFNLYGWAGFRQRQYYLATPKAKEEILPAIGKTPRECLIGLAEKMREFDPQVFLQPVYQNKPRHIKFITDLRTPEEVTAGREHGAYLVKIDRPGRPQIECRVSAMLRGTPDVWSEIILNTGTLSDLRDQSLEFCDRVCVPHIQKCLLEKR
jgi:hypothetical protein